MEVPFMRGYALALMQASHKRGTPAMCGMSALIPIKNDPVANVNALAGNGCVPIHNLMEDAATAEISRSQVWQWVVSPKGILDDGRKVTVEMVRPMIAEELAKVKTFVAAQGEDTASYDQAAVIFDEMSLTPEYPEFLTLPLYEAMA